MVSKSFLSGAAQVDITPPLGTIINGDFITHYANYIHDSLFAKAVALQSDGTLVVFVVVDICIMPKEFIDQVKGLVCAKNEQLQPHQIMISSTHTHAAGSVADVHLTGPDMLYRKKLPLLIAEAVDRAIANLEPAEIAFGTAHAPEHVLCRRYHMSPTYVPVNPVNDQADQIKTNPFGGETEIIEPVAEVDPELGFFAVRSITGKYIALLANYSLHYVGDWQNGTLSADYFGVFASQIKNQLGADDSFVGIMSNGTSGDINIWDFKNEKGYPSGWFEKSERIGTELAEKVSKVIGSCEWQQPDIDIAFDTLKLNITKPDEAELKRAADLVATSNYETLVADQAGLRSLYAREQLMLNEFPDTLEIPLQCIKLGDGVVGALPGEFFAETGLYLKSNRKSRYYFTVSMANGNVGYVPPKKEKERGGYETWRCRYSCLEEDAEAIIREKLLELVNE